MKKLKLLVGLTGLIGVLCVGIAASAGAQTFRTGDNTTVGSTEVIDGTLYVSGRTVDVSAEVNGDVYCAGQNVTISGKVHGDVLCAAQTLQILGEVDGDIRVAGQTVTLQGRVAGNATIAAQSFVQDSKSQIGKDLTLGTSDATLNGQVGRDVVLGGSSVVMSGLVGRNITGSTGSFRIENSAKVGGKIEYTSDNQLQKSDRAIIGGPITRHQPKESDKSKRGAVFGFAFGWFMYCLTAMLLITLVLALLVPRALRVLTDRALKSPWKPLLIGFIAAIAVPIAIIISALTIVGVPLAIMISLVWLIIVFMSGPVSGFYIGRQVLQNSENPISIAVVGSSILLLLYFIPFIGFFALLLGFWLGSGLILQEAFARLPVRDAANTAHKRKVS